MFSRRASFTLICAYFNIKVTKKGECYVSSKRLNLRTFVFFGKAISDILILFPSDNSTVDLEAFTIFCFSSF